MMSTLAVSLDLSGPPSSQPIRPYLLYQLKYNNKGLLANAHRKQTFTETHCSCNDSLILNRVKGAGGVHKTTSRGKELQTTVKNTKLKPSSTTTEDNYNRWCTFTLTYITTAGYGPCPNHNATLTCRILTPISQSS